MQFVIHQVIVNNVINVANFRKSSGTYDLGEAKANRAFDPMGLFMTRLSTFKYGNLCTRLKEKQKSRIDSGYLKRC